MALSPLLIRGMMGLGDNIYQRAALRELTGQTVYLETAWPQLYEGLPIRCVRRVTKLRTQEKNANRRDVRWHAPPAGLSPRTVHYVASTGTMLQGLFDCLRLNPPSVTFDLPRFPALPARPPYIVIRPSTVRTEWRAEGRNPLPQYLAIAADKLREHFHIVSVADLAPGVEWLDGTPPYADETFHHGELQVEQLLSLIAGAAGVVGGVGWMVPAAVAYRVPMFLVFGGWGVCNGPARIFDHRMNLENVHQAIPDRFCMCRISSHACDKRIGNIAEQLDQWAMGLVARRESAMVPRIGDWLLPRHGEPVRAGLLGALSADG